MSGCSVNPLSWGHCAGDAIGPVLGGAGKAVAGGVFDSIAHAFGDAASAAVNWLWTQISSATAIDLTGPGMEKLYGISAAIGVLIAVAMFCVQVIACALRQDFGGLGRAVRGMAISSLGVIFAIGATVILLRAVDALSAGVVQAATGTNVEGMGKKLVIVSVLSKLNSAGLFLFSIVLLISVVIIWCALMIRKMLIVVAAVFAPIAFAGSTSDLTKGWTRKWIEFTVALVFSKLILVIIFMIGLSTVNGAGSTGGVSNAVTNLAVGALTLLLAGFAPWIAIKMVHFTGDHFQQVHGQASAARAGGAAVVAAPQKASAMHSQVTAVHSKLSNGGGEHGGARPAAAKQDGATPTDGPAAPGRGRASGDGAAMGAAGMAGGVATAGAQAAKEGKDRVVNAVQQGQDAASRTQGPSPAAQPPRAPAPGSAGSGHTPMPPTPEARPPRQ